MVRHASVPNKDILPKQLPDPVSLGHPFYYCALALYVIATVIGDSTIVGASTIKAMLQAALLCVITLHFLREGTKIARPLAFAAWCLLLVVSAWLSKNLTLIWLTLFIAASPESSLERTARTVRAASVLGLLVTLVALKLGLASNVLIYRSTADQMRYSMGFVHPNRLGLLLLVIGMCHMVIKWRCSTLKDLFMLCALTSVALWVADSRASTYSLFLVVAVVAGARLNLWRHDSAFSRYFLRSALFITPLISVVAMLRYDDSNDRWRPLDAVLSGRAFLTRYYYETYGVPLFGSDLSEVEIVYYLGVPYRSLTLDNSVAYLLIVHGAVTTLALFYLIFRSVADRSPRHPVSEVECFGIGIMALLALAEVAPIGLGSNFFLIILRDFFCTRSEGLRHSKQR